MSDDSGQVDQEQPQEQHADWWGDPISRDRQLALDTLAEQQRRWAEQLPATRGGSPLKDKDDHFTGAEVFWLAKRALAGPEGGPDALAEAERPLGFQHVRGFQGVVERYALNLSALHLEGANLSGAHLAHANLSGAHLEGANLSGAHLAHARLRRAHLVGADFSEAQMEGVNLDGANLALANLFRAHLEHANLSGAHLEHAILSEAQLKGSDLNVAQMEDVSFGAAQMEGADLSGAQMRGATLRHAQLKGAKLRQTQLQKADFIGAQLEEADLQQAHLERADFSLAQLKGAKLQQAHLEGADFMAAHLEEADLSRTQLEGANLLRTHLEGANLTEAHLERADLTEAHLERANLSKAHLEHTNLSGVFLDTSVDVSTVVWTTATESVGPQFADVHWGEVNLTAVDWESITILGDEQLAAQRREATQAFTVKSLKQRQDRVKEYKAAGRAYRLLFVALRSQGLTAPATRYRYRAEIMDRKASWHAGQWGRWLFSWLLGTFAGYGDRLGRLFATYGITVSLFALVMLGAALQSGANLSLDTARDALVLSVTSFHGRGVQPPGLRLTDTLAMLAGLEAVFGLLIEGLFIAAFTRRVTGG